MFNFVWAMLNI